MRIEVHHRCGDSASYRAARVKGLFNVESGCNVDLSAELPIEGIDWRIGLIVGPSGSGKSSLGARVFGDDRIYRADRWPARRPIIDAIAPRLPFDEVAAALSAVGLGSVPAWLRPYRVLSNGERFRADLARIIAERPAEVVIDEFTSVVDRQAAKVGAAAFGKAWRRGDGRCVCLTCHYDVIDWLGPDWVYDTATGAFSGRGLQRRPAIELRVYRTDWRYWPMFEAHHYLKLPRMVAATNYVGTVAGQAVAHVAVSTRPGLRMARAARFVVMPEWQGIGIGLAFLEAVSELWAAGRNRYGRPMVMTINTAHPGLCRAMRRSRRWEQISCKLYGANKRRAAESLSRSAAKVGGWSGTGSVVPGYGGHFRAIQGFKFVAGAARRHTVDNLPASKGPAAGG